MRIVQKHIGKRKEKDLFHFFEISLALKIVI